jgi:ABC-2 type transport system permease protein
LIATLRSEWVKVATVRTHAILVILAVIVPTLVTGIFVSVTGDPVGLSGDDIIAFLGSGMIISLMLLGVSAVLAVSSEYVYNTVRVTYAITPQRWRVGLSKALVNAFVAVLAVAVTVAVTWGMAATIIDRRGGGISLDDGEGTGTKVAAMILAGLVFALFGTGLGLLIRNSSLGVTLLVLWPLLLENIASLLAAIANLGWIVKWFPLQAVMGEMTTPGDDALAWPWSVLWPLGFGLGLVALGMLVDGRRDA